MEEPLFDTQTFNSQQGHKKLVSVLSQQEDMSHHQDLRETNPTRLSLPLNFNRSIFRSTKWYSNSIVDIKYNDYNWAHYCERFVVLYTER